MLLNKVVLKTLEITPNYSYHSRYQLTRWRLWRDPELVTILKL